MDRSDAWFLVVTSLAVGFIFGAAFFDLTHVHWLYDYQTLIAGILAILAAAVSVTAVRDQIKEQRKQTTFLVGDAPPTVDILAEDFTQAYIQIVNWNRRAFLIDKIVPEEGITLFASLDEIEIDNVKYTIPDGWDGDFKTAQRVPGRIDQNLAPKLARFKVRVFFTDGEGADPRRQLITVNVYGRLVGEEHKTLTLPAKAVVYSH